MTSAQAHLHAVTGHGLFEPVIAVAALLAAGTYARAAGRLRHRGDVWPRWRGVSFTAGSAAVAWAAAGPVPGGPFTAHMTQHLILGMTAPLLLVLARPLTLALRILSPGVARRGLLALAHSRPADWLTFPPLAALLDLGGLWLLYRTELFSAMQHRPLLHAVVHAHVMAAGLLFTFAVCRLDPVRRRWGLLLRGTTLLAAGAAHAVLAKSLYGAPPPGTAFRAADLHTGSQVMYYGGDLVEAALATVLAASWYQFTGRVQMQRRRRADAGRRPRAATGAAAGPGTAVRASDRHQGRAGTGRHACGGRQAEGHDVRFRERHEDGLSK
ncbi:cytochrome c oxidase assembly protein [Streptomyces atroolivaceus]|uniref:cytochrome c oxidase assembly protein n=1 Tax=Streptomyces atroolivaceus TaxID=66869 RepID=UPI0020242D7C|nr:cytochrome c oxidase assembly protein [Streptomyces atroolivaceus]